MSKHKNSVMLDSIHVSWPFAYESTGSSGHIDTHGSEWSIASSDWRCTSYAMQNHTAYTLSSAVVLQFVNATTSHLILYEGILLTRTCAQEPRTSSQIYPFWLIVLVPHSSWRMMSSTSSSDSSEANFEAVLLLYSHPNSPSSCRAWHSA